MSIKERDYERGQKHGNETKYAEKVNFTDLMAGESYCKGKKAVYDQRHANAGFWGSTRKKDPDTRKEKTSKNNSGSHSADCSYSGES